MITKGKSRLIIDILGILILGILTAVFIYPILHELSHTIAALAVGGKVVSFDILPSPNVLCDVTRVDKLGIMFIGLCGIFIPCLIAFNINPKSFWAWYISFIIKGICMLSLGISAVCIALYKNGVTIKNEDIVQVLDVYPQYYLLLLLMTVIMFVYGANKIICEKPIHKVMEYFGL